MLPAKNNFLSNINLYEYIDITYSVNLLNNIKPLIKNPIKPLIVNLLKITI